MLFEPQRRDIDYTTATYTDIMLTGFNTHRANHSGPDLTWNDTLASAAQQPQRQAYLVYMTSKFRPSMTNIHFDMPFAGYCLCSNAKC